MLTEREMDTKVCSKCREVKTLDGFGKMRDSKDGYRPECKACKKEINAKYHAANPEKEKERQAKYHAANSEKIKERNAEYRAANPEKEKERSANYHAANPEKNRAWSSNSRAAKLKAIPKWLTEEDWQSMEAIGKEADRLTRETGIKYEVDHIHPLQPPKVIMFEGEMIPLICAFHCPQNLQILTKSENCAKSNKFTPYVESELTY